MNDIDKKLWIEFIKDIKNSQLAKMNASAIKIGSAITLLAAALLFFANSIPSQKPKPIIEQIIFIFIILQTLSLSIFNIYNKIFRVHSFNSNLFNKYNELEKQFIHPYLFYSVFQNFILLIFNIISIKFISVYTNISKFPTYMCMLYNLIISANLFFAYFRNYIFNNKPISSNEGIKKNIRPLPILDILVTSFILYQIYELYSIDFIFINKDILLYPIYLFCISISFGLFSRYLSNRIIYSWLEKFYIKIFKYNLSKQEIKEIFLNEFTFNDNFETIAFYDKKDFLCEFSKSKEYDINN